MIRCAHCGKTQDPDRPAEGWRKIEVRAKEGDTGREVGRLTEDFCPKCAPKAIGLLRLQEEGNGNGQRRGSENRGHGRGIDRDGGSD